VSMSPSSSASASPILSPSPRVLSLSHDVA
jgi:hypothetical protein